MKANDPMDPSNIMYHIYIQSSMLNLMEQGHNTRI